MFRIASLLALIANAALGIMVYFGARHRPANRGFVILSLFIGLWLSCLVMGATVNSVPELVFWVRASLVTAAFMPFGLDIMRILIGTQGTLLALFKTSRTAIWLAVLALVTIMSYTPLFLISAELTTPPLTVPVPRFGPAYPLYPAYFLSAVACVLYCVLKDMRSSRGIRRLEYQFLLMGVGATLCGGAVFLVVDRLLGSPEIGRFLPLAVVVMDCFIAYGIATRRIMSVPYVLHRILAYTTMALYLSTVYGVWWFAVEWTLRLLAVTPGYPLPHLVATLAVAISVVPARGWAQRFAERMFLLSPVAHLDEAIDRAGRILQTVKRLDSLLQQFAAVIEQNLGAEGVWILLSNEDGSEFLQQFPPEENNDRFPLRFDRASSLVRGLESRGEPLVRDVLERSSVGDIEGRVEAWMAREGIAMAVGVQAKLGLQGIILIGQRKNGRVYDALEQRALQLLANQLGVALENAKLYTALQDSKMYADIIVDSLVSGLVVTDLDGRVTVMNRKAQELTGVLPSTDGALTASQLPTALRRMLAETMERLTGVQDRDVTVARGDGRAVPLRVSSAVVRGHRGEARGALLLASDMTEMKRMEEQVRRTDRLSSLGTLSAGMAHEIKNPLVSLKTFTQLLPERYGDEEFRDTFFNLVGHEITRIDSIVNQLLGFARPVSPELVQVPLHRVLDDSMQLVKQQAAGHGVRMDRRFDAPRDGIRGDTDLLKQAFLNFLLNAVDAMPKGGALTVSTDEVSDALDGVARGDGGARIRVRIADTGVGIDPDDLRHVFDPFFTTKSTGTGLGLSVAHGILQEHQAGIDVSSEVGRGTTFTLLFPLIEELEEAPA